MFTQEMTAPKQEQVQERPAHLVLHLRAPEAQASDVLPPSSIEEKVIAFVGELMSSPLFELQQPFLQKWQAEALPEFKVVDTRDEKIAAAQDLAFLFIEVIAKAKLNPQNLRKQRQIDVHQKALEVLLKPLLPVGMQPGPFLARAVLADKKTAQLEGQKAIVSHGSAVQLQALQAEEEALNRDLLAHLASIQAEAIQLSNSTMEKTQAERKNLLAIAEEVHAIHQDLTAATVKTAESATKLQAVDDTLKLVLEDCRSTLNERITR